MRYYIIDTLNITHTSYNQLRSKYYLVNVYLIDKKNYYNEVVNLFYQLTANGALGQVGQSVQSRVHRVDFQDHGHASTHNMAANLV